MIRIRFGFDNFIDGHNLFRMDAVTAMQSNGEKHTGLKLATLHSTMANDDPDRIFSGFLSALVKWLLSMIVLSPDLYGPVTII